MLKTQVSVINLNRELGFREETKLWSKLVVDIKNLASNNFRKTCSVNYSFLYVSHLDESEGRFEVK